MYHITYKGGGKMNSQFAGYMSKYSFISSSEKTDNLAFSTWPIRVKPLADKRINDAHFHSGTQIWYTVSGEYKHMINGVKFNQSAGSAAIILPYSIHQIDSRESNLGELNVISVSLPQNSFTDENIPFLAHTYTRSSFDFFPISTSFSFSGESKKTVDKLFCDMLDEFRRHYDMNLKKLYSYVSSFFEICSVLTKETLSKKEILSAKQKFECVNNAVSYISDNLEKPITLENISREAMMSQRSFTSAFTEIIGKTCHSYVIAARMNNAVTLLKRTNKSLDEISAECGFYDRTHFIKLFKSYFGVTPTAWRSDFLEWKEKNEEYVIAQELREYEWLSHK